MAVAFSMARAFLNTPHCSWRAKGVVHSERPDIKNIFPPKHDMFWLIPYQTEFLGLSEFLLSAMLFLRVDMVQTGIRKLGLGFVRPFD